MSKWVTAARRRLCLGLGCGLAGVGRCADARWDLWPAELQQLTQICDACFSAKASACVIVVGPEDSGKDQLIASFLQQYGDKSGRNAGFTLAVVDSEVCENDQQAVASLCSQLAPHAQSLGADALQAAFRAGSSVGRPAVVVVRGMDRFAVGRQSFLYLLLDLMQRRGLGLLVIGLTANARISIMLEKRVVSRLNAQFIYTPRLTAVDCCLNVVTRLLLPEMDAYKEEENEIEQLAKRAKFQESENDFDRNDWWLDYGEQEVSTDVATEIFEYTIAFNEAVVRLFVNREYCHPHISSNQINKSSTCARLTPNTVGDEEQYNIDGLLPRAFIDRLRQFQRDANSNTSPEGVDKLKNANATHASALMARKAREALSCATKGEAYRLIASVIEMGKEYE
jgi:hypothetical protein